MKKPILISIAVITAICLVSCKSTSLSGKDFPSAEDSIVEVQGGKIFGALSDDGVVISYKGIPYAAAPVGELRWEDPQDVEPWDGVRECTSLGHNCIQWSESESTGFAKEFGIDLTLGSSEDCLTANVWTLNGDQENKKPVVVFIHGGGYVLGGSSCPVYGGESLARKGVVFISINYRLGAFGFLSLDETGEKSNFALKDCIKALEWVRDNSDVFGGDASNVTIIGQSAGAGLVRALIVSPKAEGLYSNAMVVSGRGSRDSHYSDPETAYRLTKSILGDQSIDELRAMDAKELATIVGRNISSMVIDGTFITGDCNDIHDSGSANKVVVFNGFVSGDPNLFSGKRYIRTKQAYEEAVRKQFGDFAEKVLAVYPATDETAQEMIYLLEQEEYLGSVMWEAEKFNSGTGKTSYAYYAAHPYPQKSEQTALAHTEDLAYWFNNFSDIREPYLTDYDYKLADTMSDFIVSFATDGDPNGKGLPTWNANTGDGSYMLFGEDVSCEKMSQSKLDLWMEYYSNNN